MTADPAAVTRALADETNNIALIICSTSGSAGGPALTTAEHIVAHLASVLASLPDDRLAEAEAKVRRALAVLDEADQRHEDAELTTVPLVSVIAVRTALLRVQNGAALSGGDTT